MQQTPWSNEEIELLKQVYLTGKLSDIASLYFPNRSPIAVRNYAIRLGLKKSKQDSLNRKRRINETVFDEWSEVSAYLLGVIAADGCVVDRPQGSCIAFCISAADTDWLENIAALFGDLEVKRYTAHHKGIGKEYETAQLKVNSRKLVEKVIRLGIPPRKSLTLEFPAIPQSFVHHFVRGYFDGDGSVYLKTSRSGNKHVQAAILGTKPFLEKIAEILIAIGYGDSYLRQDGNHYVLTLSNSANIHLFSEWLYRDASIYLARKHLKFTV